MDYSTGTGEPASAPYGSSTTNNSSSHQPTGSYGRVSCSPEYIPTLHGILKIVEMVCALLTFACSLGGYWSFYGGGWVEFVSFVSLLVTAAWFTLHMISYLPTFLTNYPTELISYVVMAALFLIAAIVAAARASQLKIGAIGAAAFFAFACTALYGVETFFLFREWRSGGGSGGGGGQPRTATTITTGSTTTTPTGPQTMDPSRLQTAY